MNRYRPGDQVTALCDDTTDTRGVHTVTIHTVDLLGCGCQRLRTLRPGPQPDDYPAYMELLTGCSLHESFRTA